MFSTAFSASRDPLADALEKVFRYTDVQSDSALLAVLRDADLRPALASMRTTTLLLHGELGPIIAAEKIETLAQSITCARHQLMPTGQFPLIEAPEAFAKTLIRFLAQ